MKWLDKDFGYFKVKEKGKTLWFFCITNPLIKEMWIEYLKKIGVKDIKII